jgi:hydrogenase maturation protein HypF
MTSILAAPISTIERRRIRIEGIVQGVGFRPFVFNLAERYALGGWVLNDSTGVVVEAEGEPRALDEFTGALERQAPVLARIIHVRSEALTPKGELSFSIAPSAMDQERRAWISPDASTCEDCLRELYDPANRRYRYPFINCTHCGPRFTIIRDVPYDRPFTTMAPFQMCPACRREYDDPHDRRFHAQPNACPTCGPTMRWLNSQDAESVSGDAAIERAAHSLHAGQIIAIKGLGGYHLACDAANESAVTSLRERKHRYDKPFALMVRDVGSARALCELDATEESLLTSRRRPIVLLRARRPGLVAAQVAPRHDVLGVMLPYSPLHSLLLDAFRGQGGGALVLTSGNVSEEPIAYQDEDARDCLSGIADGFLSHDRAIHMRCDDSVARVVGGQELLLRRSRGYAPEPIRAPVPFHEPILATGAHLKNTFCLGKGDYAFVSHHIGDLENYETLQSFSEGIEHFQRIFDVEPRVLAYDLHPGYLATQYALERPDSLTKIGVQHHHAHIASVMGEHGLTRPVIGVAFDGTGYGANGTLWGGEFLIAEYARFERAAHLELLPLLGGEQAIREVWRLAAAWLDKVYGNAFLDLDLDFVRRIDRARWRVLRQMGTRDINAPRSSSMGRLFDAVSALCGVRAVARYEGQAAIELEMLADKSCTDAYPFEIIGSQPRLVYVDRTLRAIVTDLQHGVTTATIASRFHNTVAELVVETCAALRDESGLNTVALGGGVFQNAFLLTRTLNALRAREFEVFVPTKLPPNDGGLAYGQALVANAVAHAGLQEGV